MRTWAEERGPRPLDPLRVGRHAHRALLKEAELTPKPGLVDRDNSGAHRDMDLSTFRASAAAIAPWFPAFHRLGAATRGLAPMEVLPRLRAAGTACERDMLRATGGVNTHKGGVFSLGLLCTASGRLDSTDPAALCAEVARMCEGLVERELAAQPSPRTAGEKAYRDQGLPGARGEAASGFATVRRHGLPAFRRIVASGGSEETALHEALLHLMAANADTNLVRRGGAAGLARVQARAAELIAAGGAAAPGFRERMLDFDRELIALNLSPGGSADLLAATWFLATLPATALPGGLRGPEAPPRFRPPLPPSAAGRPGAPIP